MEKKQRGLAHDEPMTTVELAPRWGGSAGRRLHSRVENPGHMSTEAESQVLVEQATGLLAERCQLSIEEARDVLVQDAAGRGLTMREAAERLLRRAESSHGEVN